MRCEIEGVYFLDEDYELVIIYIATVCVVACKLHHLQINQCDLGY